MKKRTQRHPRLYINISNKNDFYKLDYYDNQYDENGNFITNFTLMESSNFVNKSSDLDKLFKLNKAEFQLLDILIKKQQKVLEIYSSKNKKEQYKVVSSSLDLLFDYLYHVINSIRILCEIQNYKEILVLHFRFYNLTY